MDNIRKNDVSAETNEHWCWFLVITNRSDVQEAFNSLPGAESWQEKHGVQL